MSASSRRTKAPYACTEATLPLRNFLGSKSLKALTSLSPAGASRSASSPSSPSSSSSSASRLERLLCFFRPPPRGPPDAAAADSSTVFIVSAICRLSASTLSTRTATSSPTLAMSLGFATKEADIWEMCTRPSDSAPMSTKTPKSLMPFTLPCSSVPTASSDSAVRFLRGFFSPPSSAAGCGGGGGGW